MRTLLLYFTCCLISSVSFAEALLDFGGAYSADTSSTTTKSSNANYFYNINALFNLDRRAQWNFGWTLFAISQARTEGGVDTTYSSLDLGPALRWNIDKSGIFSLTAAYGYLAKGKYSSGGSEEDWEGTSYFGQFAVQAPIRDDKFYIGFSLNYYAANYPKKTVNKVESANEAQRSWIFPMISLTWRP